MHQKFMSAMSPVMEIRKVGACGLDSFFNMADVQEKDLIWHAVKNEDMTEFWHHALIWNVVPRVDRQGNCSFIFSVEVFLFEDKKQFSAFLHGGYDEAKRPPVKIECTPIQRKKKGQDPEDGMLV